MLWLHRQGHVLRAVIEVLLLPRTKLTGCRAILFALGEPHGRQNVLYSRQSSLAQAGFRLSQP